VETVKQKSETIVNVYKEDLNEFSRTLVNDTTTVLQDKLASLRVFDGKKNAANTTSPIQQQNRIARLQRNESTFTQDPSDTAAFATWTNQFDIGAHTESVTHLLTTNETVREFHTRLVPAQVSYREFWCRYYYKLQCLLEDDKRRAALLKSAIANDEEELSWDVEDEKQQQQTTVNTEMSPPKTEEPKEEPPKETPPIAITPITTTSANTNLEEGGSPEGSFTQIQPSPPITPTTVNTPTDPTIPTETAQTQSTSTIEDEIDHEIAQKYVEIKSEKERDKDREKGDKSDDEWASWE